jgi:hypothetical protein
LAFSTGGVAPQELFLQRGPTRLLRKVAPLDLARIAWCGHYAFCKLTRPLLTGQPHEPKRPIPLGRSMIPFIVEGAY